MISFSRTVRHMPTHHLEQILYQTAWLQNSSKKNPSLKLHDHKCRVNDDSVNHDLLACLSTTAPSDGNTIIKKFNGLFDSGVGDETLWFSHIVSSACS
jgi:hypothetical protein